jgi:hypothetical protein
MRIDVAKCDTFTLSRSEKIFGRPHKVAQELELNKRRYWILSEPYGDSGGWKARVAEVCEDGSSEEVGIEATGGTRGAADDAAERKLRRLVKAC